MSVVLVFEVDTAEQLLTDLQRMTASLLAQRQAPMLVPVGDGLAGDMPPAGAPEPDGTELFNGVGPTAEQPAARPGNGSGTSLDDLDVDALKGPDEAEPPKKRRGRPPKQPATTPETPAAAEADAEANKAAYDRAGELLMQLFSSGSATIKTKVRELLLGYGVRKFNEINIEHGRALLRETEALMKETA